MLRTAESRLTPPLPRTRRRRDGVLTLGVTMSVAAAGLLAWAAFARPLRPSRALTIGPQSPVTPQDQGLGAANNSPILAADPGDAGFLALANRRDAPDYACGLHVSGDGGKGWVPVQPVPQLPAGAEKCYAPEVAIDATGTLHYLFVGLAGAGNHPVGAFLTSSTDRGRTFSVPRQVLGPENFSVRMVVDPTFGPRGRIHLVWLHAASPTHLGGFGEPPNPILAAHSDDGGATFSEPVQVSDPDRRLVNAPAVAIGRDHAVHVAYYDLGDDRRDYDGLEGPAWEEPWTLVLATSTDGGSHFGRGSVAEAQVIPAERVMLIFTMAPPSLAADGKRVCLAWTDGRHSDADALLRCSEDQGRTWGPARRLNDDPVDNGRSQYLPRLSIAPDGRIDAIFYDRRQDPHNANADVSYAFSADGGRTFSANAPLTTEGLSYTLIGQEYGIPSAAGMFDFGSRIALLSGRDHVVAAWTDTHNSAPPTRAQDIFSVQVHVGARTRVSATPAVTTGLLLLLAGSFAVVRARRRRGEPAELLGGEGR